MGWGKWTECNSSHCISLINPMTKFFVNRCLREIINTKQHLCEDALWTKVLVNGHIMTALGFKILVSFPSCLNSSSNFCHTRKQKSSKYVEFANYFSLLFLELLFSKLGLCF